MNRTEVIKLIRVCSANYRNWPEEGKEADTVQLWESMLEDMPYDVAKAAVQAHISKSVYPPTIADIRESAVMLTNRDSMDAMEAWGEVVKAIRKYGFYGQEKAMASLPPEVKEMVERFTWRELCLSENIDTLRAQFRMAWETLQKRRREESKIPVSVMNLIETSNAVKRLE